MPSSEVSEPSEKLVPELHSDSGVRGATRDPRGFGPMSRGGAGWRRAHRLASYAILPSASLATEIRCEIPIDMGENSAIVKSVDANVPPDQPPSIPDSPAPIFPCGLSASGIAFEPSTFPPLQQASVASPGCGVTPFTG